jgi:tRNA threonylcarbamoyladenosine biosynthesis protein TsaE
VIEYRTTGAADSRAVGVGIAAVLVVGDVVVLTGDLGTGKTVVAQGIAAGLGVTDRVVSPTFALVREYEGRLPLHHLDVYRLDRLQEAIDLGWDELLDDGVVVVEWGEGVAELLPADRLEVTLAFDPDDEDHRLVAVAPQGRRWTDREATLHAAVAAARAAVPAC